jgi:uncharacterized caspase-like protein
MNSSSKKGPGGLLATIALWLALPLVAPVQVRAETRVLILGADYSSAPDQSLHLGNTLLDARAVASMFVKLGLADVRLVQNPTGTVWQSETRDFVERLATTDVAVVYYAGHAVQVAGSNYFLSGDGAELIPMSGVLAAVMAKAHGAVFIVDACRNNPFRESARSGSRAVTVHAVNTTKNPLPRTQSPISAIDTLPLIKMADLRESSGGLSQFGDLRGANALVLFSTDPGNVALDGDQGQGSPFATTLVQQLGRKQSLDAAIRRITGDVGKKTGGRQSPWRQVE